jgi:multidrug resistance protein, MATE family
MTEPAPSDSHAWFRGRGSPGDVLRIAFPLIVASSGHALRLFVDRVMLAHYAPASIAASMPAGLLSFTFMSVFIGIAGYAGAFVAQYTGAGQPRRTGLAVWQAIYVALAGGVVVALIGHAAPWIFRCMGHAPEVQVEQITYFQTLAPFGVAGIGLAGINGFWSGRGHTRVVMSIELLCAALNVILNTALIFGRFGAPRMGIAGAALATGLSNVAGCALALALFLRPANRAAFDTLPRRTFDGALFRRLLRFGFPNGLQFMLDLLAFNLFVMYIGRTGPIELEAANIAFSLNALAFMPIIGMGATASILVGQGVGAGDTAFAQRAVRSAFLLGVLYNAIVGTALLFFPGAILTLFARAGDSGQATTLAIAAVCLRYIAAYLVFDAACIIYSHAVKGAGDTKFTMWVGLAMSWGTLVLPCAIATRLGADNWVLWRILVIHIGIAACVFYARYRFGPWRTMRVIETPDALLPGHAEMSEIEVQASRGV